jgi:nicotinate-nucleotide adenylyltransferase
MAKKAKEIALFFGSFNPVHSGHLMIAQHLINTYPIDELWFVLSPQNPFKEASQLGNFYDRLEMLQLAIDANPKFKTCDIEQSLSLPSYTIHTLIALEEKHPNLKFSLIMGADNLQHIHKWKNFEQILKNYPVYVYPRPNVSVQLPKVLHQIIVTETPTFEISSSYIRKSIQDKKRPLFFVPKAVLDFIESKNLYA